MPIKHSMKFLRIIGSRCRAQHVRAMGNQQLWDMVLTLNRQASNRVLDFFPDLVVEMLDAIVELTTQHTKQIKLRCRKHKPKVKHLWRQDGSGHTNELDKLKCLASCVDSLQTYQRHPQYFYPVYIALPCQWANVAHVIGHCLSRLSFT